MPLDKLIRNVKNYRFWECEEDFWGSSYAHKSKEIIALCSQLNKLIKEEEFIFLELFKFKTDYKLYLLAGVILGYKLATKDFSEVLIVPKD